MTIADFHALRRDDGQRLLARLADEALRDDDVLPVLERYRRDYPAELVSAAVELTRLRRRGKAKFARAAAMWFTRDGLEMASSEQVAAHVARRFAGLPFALDLCCGIGGDLLALAAVVPQVVAVDKDPLALAMARANLAAGRPPQPSPRPLRGQGEGVSVIPGYMNSLPLCAEQSGEHGGRVGEGGRLPAQAADFLHADVTQFIPAGLALTPFGRLLAEGGIFIDPSRREERAAARRPEAYAPPLSWCLGLTRHCPRVAIKVSPALEFEGIDAEVEVISLGGECKEAVLWLGGFRAVARRATVLPAGAELTEDGPSSDALGEIGAYLYEPDSAVIRAGLLRRLAGELGLRRIDAEIAYLSGDAAVASPFAAGFRVREVIPWGLKRVNAALAARGIGRVEIKKRGFPLTPEALRPKLKLAGRAAAVLLCTHAQGKPVVILAERI